MPKGGAVQKLIMARLIARTLPFLLLHSFLGGRVSGTINNVGWWKNTVFYQIYPRSFMDANGDGIGDLRGITSKLEHFVDAGIGAIWLSPIYTSPMVDFGYDISNFREIDPTFGTIADFEALTARAKELGLKVILDFVPNHSADDHEWFTKSENCESPYEDYYVWHNGSVSVDGTRLPPNNWISVFSGPAWTYSEKRGQWFFHQFAKQQPDLNYRSNSVQEEMKNVLRFWLAKGVDGFRIDAVPHLVEVSDLADEPISDDVTGINPNDYPYLSHIYTKDQPLTYEIMQSWRTLLDEYADQANSDEKILMTEAYTNLSSTLKYYDVGSHIPFNFKFIMEISSSSTPADFKNTVDSWMNNMPENAVANWVMGNHDRSRTASRFPNRADQMTMLAMILPGVAVTYNGEEIGMTDTWVSWENTQDPQACNTDPTRYEAHTRDPNRSPFQWDTTTSAGFSKSASTWLPVNPNYVTLNLATQKSAATSHYKVYQKLTKLRESPVLRYGTHDIKDLAGNALCVSRTLVENGKTERVILLINFRNAQTTVDLVSSQITGVSEKVYFYTTSIGYPVVAEVEVADKTNIVLPARASIVFTTEDILNGAAQISASIVLALLPLIFKHIVT